MSVVVIGQPTITHQSTSHLAQVGSIDTSITSFLVNNGVADYSLIESIIQVMKLAEINKFMSWDVWVTSATDNTTTYNGQLGVIKSTKMADGSIQVNFDAFKGTVTFQQPTISTPYQVEHSSGRRYGFCGPRKRWTETRYHVSPRGVTHDELKWLDQLLTTKIRDQFPAIC